jgi:hypothetical protein
MPECDAAAPPAHPSTGFLLTHHTGLYLSAQRLGTGNS